MPATFTLDELAAKCRMPKGREKEAPLVMAIHGLVYDLSTFKHPGGREILWKWRGRDATKPYNAYHRWINVDMASQHIIGRLKSAPVKLKGGSADEAERMRGAFETLGVSHEKLSDGQLLAEVEKQKKAAAASETATDQAVDGEEDEDAALAEVFESLADPATQTVSPEALRNFLTQLGTPASLLDSLTPTQSVDIQGFTALVNKIDM
ncbi:hypothetical protein DIPPA_29877 [Diplonema papillatum]|nr:hypothetical protein DIPPA_29877 [Diplonema papillatum]